MDIYRGANVHRGALDLTRCALAYPIGAEDSHFLATDRRKINLIGRYI
jgi:hypothetical protein